MTHKIRTSCRIKSGRRKGLRSSTYTDLGWNGLSSPDIEISLRVFLKLFLPFGNELPSVHLWGVNFSRRPKTYLLSFINPTRVVSKVLNTRFWIPKLCTTSGFHPSPFLCLVPSCHRPEPDSRISRGVRLGGSRYLSVDPYP